MISNLQSPPNARQHHHRRNAVLTREKRSRAHGPKSHLHKLSSLHDWIRLHEHFSIGIHTSRTAADERFSSSTGAEIDRTGSGPFSRIQRSPIEMRKAARMQYRSVFYLALVSATVGDTSRGRS